MEKKVLIILPAYNEEKSISKVINSIKKEGFKDILIIDDNSLDNTYKVLKNQNVKVLKHNLNRGAGAATNTGLCYAKKEEYDFVVFLDSDGQHDPKEIKKLLKSSKKYDVVIGSRMISNLREMPIQRRIANLIGSIFTKFFFGLFVKDSQSGFKVFNKNAIEKINLTFDRYEFCSEIIGEIYKHNLTWKEIPIKIIYSNHSLKNEGSGQSIFNGFKMIFKFIFKN